MLRLKLPLSADFAKSNSAPQELACTNASDDGAPSGEDVDFIVAETAKRRVQAVASAAFVRASMSAGVGRPASLPRCLIL